MDLAARMLAAPINRRNGSWAEWQVGGPITARMLDDGTFEGELTTNRGRTKWTGEGLQKT
jgi:hypothetical protein